VKLDACDLEVLLKRLHLAFMRRSYRDVIARAEAESWTYKDFLTLLVAEEVAQRQQTRIQRCVRAAHFPFLKTIEEFNFAYQTSLRLAALGSYLSADFVTDGRCLLLHGKSGRGKTHLAIAIAYRAIQNGFEALFTTAAGLIDELSRASRMGCLVDRLATYIRPHVLIVDEVGYLALGPDAANVLFHVVNERHLRRRPMIFTTNKLPKNWGRVLHDDDLAEAIVDRVMERGRLIQMDGPSIRNPHGEESSSEAPGTSGQDLKRARISGKLVPEFPEPAPGSRA
jgi:DNA replication protein DnaC